MSGSSGLPGRYSKALYEVKCDNLSKNQIVNNIIKIYETN